jgi:hypothetical protein
MLQAEPRDVAATILDDLVDLQIAGPAASTVIQVTLASTQLAAPEEDAVTAPASEITTDSEFAAEPEPEAEFERLAEPVAVEPVVPTPAIDVHESEPMPPIDLMPVSSPQPALVAASDIEPADGELSAALHASPSPAIPAEHMPDHDPDEVMVLRSLLAECGTIVRWLCTKAEAGDLRGEDIEVARSFLAMAGLPAQQLAASA